jgi:phage tail sheath protein FI
MLTKGDNNMAFQLSPGINVSEIDLTTVVPAVSSTTGAVAGVFAWGPVNEPILVSSEVDLVKRFGKPITGHNTETFFTAADFLAYGNSLYVVRADTGVVANTGTMLQSANASLGISAGLTTSGLSKIESKYKGELGNALRVVIIGKTAYASNSASVSRFVTREPTTTRDVHIVVIDTTGQFTGVSNSAVEVFEDVSVFNLAKTEDGTNSFMIDAINDRSNYITLTANATFTANVDATAVVLANTALNITLSGGDDGDAESAVSANTLIDAYDLYKSPESIDISLIMTGKSANAQLANHIIDNICEFRKDCMMFVSPKLSDVVTGTSTNINAQANVVSFATGINSSSYAVIDSGYKYRYDRYNDRYIYTPLNGDIAGLCVRTDETRDPWFSPAGYNRGAIKNVIKLAWNPNKTERDQLYKNRVNPVVSQPGQGTILFGDKTALSRASAFDRINVRRLFIVLEKAISRASQSTLFEFNDEFTRAQFKNLVEPFLRDVQGRRGIYDFRVVCDETNNTSEIIDRNEFVGDIYIKPARAINFIQLNFVAVRTGVEFEEIIGQR